MTFPDSERAREEAESLASRPSPVRRLRPRNRTRAASRPRQYLTDPPASPPRDAASASAAARASKASVTHSWRLRKCRAGANMASASQGGAKRSHPPSSIAATLSRTCARSRALVPGPAPPMTDAAASQSRQPRTRCASADNLVPDTCTSKSIRSPQSGLSTRARPWGDASSPAPSAAAALSRMARW